MIIRMRTTIVIEDDLFQLAKRRAAETGRTLSDIIGAALRESFHAAPPARRERFRMPTFGGSRKQHHEPSDFARMLEEDDRDSLKG